MKLTLKGSPITRRHQLTKSLKMIILEFHLVSDDSANDVYDDDGDDFKAESQITQ